MIYTYTFQPCCNVINQNEIFFFFFRSICTQCYLFPLFHLFYRLNYRSKERVEIMTIVTITVMMSSYMHGHKTIETTIYTMEEENQNSTKIRF